MGEERAGFLLKRWIVAVDGYGEESFTAPTRGAAMANAWRCDAFSSSTFSEFLKFARCRRDQHQPHGYGDEITVCGKPAFFVGANRQYVQIAYPGGQFVLNPHPYDVLPERYRPTTYGGQA
jgi:hypothetical protein